MHVHMYRSAYILITTSYISSPAPPSNDMADYELPAYDDIVEDDPDDEPVMDENERIARQEEEDARIAKELFEKEQKASQAEVSGSYIIV